MEPIIKKSIYIVFNKHTGVIFSQEESEEVAKGYNPDHFVYKKIEVSPTEYFFGDYENGKIFSIEEKPLYREDEMEEKYFNTILEHYSPVKQLIIILDLIKKNKNITTTPEFDRLYEFIDSQRSIYEEQLNIVSSDKEAFNFLSIKEVADIAQKRIQGII